MTSSAFFSVWRPRTPSSSPPTKVSPTSTRPVSPWRPGRTIRAPQLARQRPGGAAASPIQNALQCQSTRPGFLARHPPHRPLPGGQRQTRVLSSASENPIAIWIVTALAELAEISGFAARARSLTMQTSNLAPNRLFVRTPAPGGIFGVTCFLGIQGHMALFEGLLWRGPEVQRGMAGAVRHLCVSCLDGVQVVFSFGKPVRARSRSGADASSVLVTSDSRPATHGFVSSLKPGLGCCSLHPQYHFLEGSFSGV